MAGGKKSLDRWLAEAMTDNTKDAQCSALAVVHMVAGNNNMAHQEIHTVKLGGTASYDPKVLADVFQNKAESYCQDLPGVQYCCLWAMYGTNQPQAKLPFLVNVHASEWNGATEAPSDTGERMQGMRHKEMSFQQVYRRQEEMDRHSIAMVSIMSRQMQELIQENREANKILIEVMREQANNAHAHRMAEQEHQRATVERRKMIEMVPPLVNTITGSEIFPQSTVHTRLFEKVAEEMTPEIAMKLAEVVPPALMGPLAACLNEIQQKQRAEREALARLPRSEQDGEDDVTGMVRQ